MKHRAWLIGAIWGAALTAAVFLYTQRKGVPQPDDGVAVHSPRTPLAPRRQASRPQAPPPAPGPARMFRGTPQHAFRSAFAAPSSPTVAWKFQTQGPISAQPLVDSAGNIYFGSHDHFFYALDANGQLRWKRDLGDRIYATPYIDSQGNLYIGSDDDAIFSFTSAGELRWKLVTRGDADTGVFATPAGEIVTAAGHDLWCLTTDGRAKWRFEAQGKIFSSPAIDTDGTIVFGAQDDLIYALAPDGRMRWSYRTRGDVDSSVLIDDDGNVYAGSDDKHVYALTREGQLKWSIEVPSFVRAPIARAADGSILVSTFGPHPELLSLDPSTGQARFRFATTAVPSEDVGIVSGALVDRAGNILFGAQDDYLYAVTATGALSWVFEAGGDIDSSPVLAQDGVLLFGADDGYLYALR